MKKLFLLLLVGVPAAMFAGPKNYSSKGINRTETSHTDPLKG